MQYPKPVFDKPYKKANYVQVANDPIWLGPTNISIDADGRLIDDNARYAFTRGQCHAFALAVHKMTGWEMLGVNWPGEDYDNEPGHVLTVTPDGQFFDIWGLKAAEYQEMVHRRLRYPLDPKPVTEEEILNFQYYSRPNVKAAIPFAHTVLTKEGYHAAIKHEIGGHHGR